MAFTAAKEICTPAELNRFACAFLNCKDIQNSIDWDAAAKQYDPAVKTQSFKTMTQRTIKKVIAAAEKAPGGDGEGGGEAKKTTAAKGKGGGGRKRKVADGDGDGDGEEGKKPAAKKGSKGKKTPEAEVEGEGGDEEAGDAEGAEVKTEGAEEDEDAF